MRIFNALIFNQWCIPNHYCEEIYLWFLIYFCMSLFRIMHWRILHCTSKGWFYVIISGDLTLLLPCNLHVSASRCHPDFTDVSKCDPPRGGLKKHSHTFPCSLALLGLRWPGAWLACSKMRHVDQSHVVPDILAWGHPRSANSMLPRDSRVSPAEARTTQRNPASINNTNSSTK